MGIPGILKEIGKGQRVALAKVAIEHLERTNRPLRIAIDAAIWSFQNQASQGGLNPSVRVFYYRLLRLLALPIHPLFVYDGPNKPKVKRNKKVGVWNSAEDKLSKQLLQLFHFPYLTAPGEAEAECAALQRRGIVDAVMSQDADTIMFGSTLTLKNWSAEHSRGSHAPSHVDVIKAADIRETAGLDTNGMILVALLSGGDYDPVGVPGFGPGIASEIAKIKEPNFAANLLSIKAKGDQQALREWREQLNHELQTNEHKYFKRRSSASIPENFPNDKILSYYTNPAISSEEKMVQIEKAINAEWAKEIDLPLNVPMIREFVRDHLDWKYKSGARKVIRGLAPALLAQQLRLRQPTTGVLGLHSILSRGQRFENDGIPEVRLELIPSQIIPIDMSLEEDRPPDSTQTEDGDDVTDQVDGIDNAEDPEVSSSQPPMSPSKKRKSPPYNPDLPEKHWFFETIIKIGTSNLLEEWDQQQEELRKDPRKWAVRKVAKPKAKAMDTTMKSGAIDSFFRASKPNSQNAPSKPPPSTTTIPSTSGTRGKPTQAKQKPIRKKTTTAAPSTQGTKPIARFFQSRPQNASSSAENIRPFHSMSSFASDFYATRMTESELEVLASPTSHKHQARDENFKPGFDISTAIELSSSPLSPVRTSLMSSNRTVLDHTPPPTFANECPTSHPSSPESLPLPTDLLYSPIRNKSQTTSFSGIPISSPPAFETMPVVSPSRIRERRRGKGQHGIATRKSSPPTSKGKLAFKSTKPGAISSKKMTVIGRDSLPGAWKEIDLSDIEEDDLKTTLGRRARKVSLVNLT